MSKESSCLHRTSIGGQAIMEGVMMRGPEKTVIAVRNPQGEIVLEPLKDERKFKKLKNIPIIRGIFNFISSLTLGFSAIERSTEIALTEEEQQPDKFDQWLLDHFGENGTKVVTGVTMFIGILLARLLEPKIIGGKYKMVYEYVDKGEDTIGVRLNITELPPVTR